MESNLERSEPSHPTVSNQVESNKIGFKGATLTITAWALGISTVVLPRIFALSGWVGGAIIILLSPLISGYVGLLLFLSRQFLAEEKGIAPASFRQLGGAYFGWKGSALICCVQNFHLFLALVVLQIVATQSLARLIPALARKYWVLVSFPPFLLLSRLSNIKVVEKLSTLFVAGLLVISVIVVVSCAVLFAGHGESGAPPYDLFPSSVFALCSSFALSIGCFSFNFLINNLVSSMESPKQFPACVSLSMLICLVFVACVGGAGYLAFGRGFGNYKDVIDAIARGGGSEAVSTVLTLLLLVIAVADFPIAMTPLAVDAEGLYMHFANRASIPQQQQQQQQILSPSPSEVSGKSAADDIHIPVGGLALVSHLQDEDRRDLPQAASSHNKSEGAIGRALQLGPARAGSSEPSKLSFGQRISSSVSLISLMRVSALVDAAAPPDQQQEASAPPAAISAAGAWLVRAVVVLLATVLALLIDNISPLVALTGAFTSFFALYLFPMLLFWKALLVNRELHNNNMNNNNNMDGKWSALWSVSGAYHVVSNSKGRLALQILVLGWGSLVAVLGTVAALFWLLNG